MEWGNGTKFGRLFKWYQAWGKVDEVDGLILAREQKEKKELAQEAADNQIGEEE